MKTKSWRCVLGLCVAGLLTMAMEAAAGLTTADVIKLSKAGISDEVIIQTLQATGTGFQLAPQDIEALTRNGVSDHVIVAMMVKGPSAAPAAAYTPPSAPAYAPANPAPSAVQYVPRPIVSSDAGNYAGSGNAQVMYAMPATPPAAYYQTAAPAPSYDYAAYSYSPGYYASTPYYDGGYYGPSVGIYCGGWPYWGGYWGGRWGGCWGGRWGGHYGGGGHWGGGGHSGGGGHGGHH